MAWTWELVSVPDFVPGTGPDGNPTQVDPTLSGEFVAVITVKDDDNVVVGPNRTYTWPHHITDQEAAEQIHKDVATVRDARFRRNQVRGYMGIIFQVP